MNSMSAGEARDKLYRLLEEIASHHEPLLITGPHSNAVLVGEEDWSAIQETLHLLSIPGMRESSGKVSPRRPISVRENWAGEAVATRLHETCSERRQASGLRWT